MAVTVPLNAPSIIFWRCIGKALSSVHNGQILEFIDSQLVEIDLNERVCSNVDLHRSRILFGQVLIHPLMLNDELYCRGNKASVPPCCVR